MCRNQSLKRQSHSENVEAATARGACLLQCSGLSPPVVRGQPPWICPPITFPPQVDELKEQLAAQQIAVTDDQVEQLDLYRRLLWSWNERMNLTRHTTMEKFVEPRRGR